MNNIFLEPFAGDHELVPFDKISVRDFEIDISDAIDVHNCEIEQITGQTDAPTFQNTIVALERSGQMLGRVLGVFYPMLSANADDELMEIAYRMAPQITEHENSIILNQALWRRVKAVHDHEEASALSDEDRMLLDKTYRAFVRQGADLEGEDRQRYRQLTGKLTKLTLKYDRNLLHEMATAQMWLTADDLTGLPATAIDAAAQQAREKGRDGEYLITLQAPSYVPFMRYSQRRDLRERLYRLYDTLCSQGDYDNTRILRQIANTRLAIAQLLGYATFADYRLTTTMAQDKEHVYDMLERLRQAYQPVQKADMNRLERFASEVEGHDVRIMPWDYSYYANRLRDHLFNINDEMLRPYFELSRVTRGVFGLATRLYGLQFTQNTEAPVYHPEVKVYDVTDADGTYMGTLYTDFFPRATKQSGAWMTNFAEQWVDADGHDHRPLVSLNMNFTRPTDTQPSLLTPSEVRTFLHEFGHGLHSLLSQAHYESLSGTNVYRDFVEMPSQFNENFLLEREFLDSFARHYLTDEPVPQQLVDSLIAASQFEAAYACIRQLGFGYLDMAWHTITRPTRTGVTRFEQKALHPVQVFEPVEECAISTHFSHIFSGGYAAGYYGYKWAEVLDADAFEMFREQGIFNPATARHLRQCILSRGGTRHPMELYVAFRGREPHIDALMRRDGITPPHQ